MTEDLPTSVSQSTVSLLGVEVVVHQLDNGERVIDGPSMTALLNAMMGRPGPLDPAEVAAFREIVGNG